MNFRDWSTHELAAACQENTRRYHLKLPYDPCACYELFRRCIVENNQEAAAHIQRIYGPMVTKWVEHHKNFAHTRESSEFLVNGVFYRFYVHVVKVFDGFPPCEVGRLLQYLKMCVNSEIEDYCRYLPLQSLDDIEDFFEVVFDIEENLTAEAFWETVKRILEYNEKDIFLVHLRYTLNMKPSEIARRHPAFWPEARRVTVDLQRIKNKLKRGFSDLGMGDSIQPPPEGLD